MEHRRLIFQLLVVQQMWDVLWWTHVVDPGLSNWLRFSWDVKPQSNRSGFAERRAPNRSACPEIQQGTVDSCGACVQPSLLPCFQRWKHRRQHHVGNGAQIISHLEGGSCEAECGEHLCDVVLCGVFIGTSRRRFCQPCSPQTARHLRRKGMLIRRLAQSAQA